MDKKTRDVFIEENMGLVHACARRFLSRGMEYDDLFQAGCMGLIKACDHFDESRGLRFSTYAVPVILGEMKRLFREGGTVKVGRALKELSMKALRESENFLKTEGRSPQIGELAERIGVSPQEAAQAISAAQIPLSLTAEGEDGEVQTDIPVDAPEEEISEKLSLRQAMGKLQKSDQLLLSERYFKSRTQTQTAELLGMTQVQVSRREKKILCELREVLK